MLFGIAADLLVVVHLAFICFVVGGGLLGLKWRRIIFPHIVAAIWGMLLEFRGWPCPLTSLENQLRQTGGEIGYSAGFVDQYIIPIVYPSNLTREIQIILGVLVLVINVVVYTFIIARFRRNR